MILKLVRTSPYCLPSDAGFAIFNNALYSVETNSKYVFKIPFRYFNKIFVKDVGFPVWGITFDGKFFYITDGNYFYVKKYDINFNLIKAYSVGSSAIGYPWWMLPANGFFYVGFYPRAGTYFSIKKYNSEFIFIRNVMYGSVVPRSMAYDGKHFYMVYYLNLNLYRYDHHFIKIDNIIPLGYQPSSIAHDGKFLYINDTNNYFVKKYAFI